MVPKLPGSETPSNAIINPCALGTSMCGIATTAIAALLLTKVLTLVKSSKVASIHSKPAKACACSARNSAVAKMCCTFSVLLVSSRTFFSP
ncbi:hypothetical protein DA89_2337 [Vibrio paracholerae]|nr:hypothetical protein DA89_2337 [Vibrio paracholerae]